MYIRMYTVRASGSLARNARKRLRVRVGVVLFNNNNRNYCNRNNTTVFGYRRVGRDYRPLHVRWTCTPPSDANRQHKASCH